jgi:hypothetical protein
MAEVDWRKQPAIERRPYCSSCRGTGICRNGKSGPYLRCNCGRMPNATASLKLANQEKLNKRFAEIKTKGW